MNIGIIPPQAYWIAIAGLVVVVGLQQVRVAGVKTDLAEEKRARSDERAVQSAFALAHTNKISALQATHAAAQQSKENDYAAKLSKLDAERRAAVADTGRLRNVIANYTALDRRAGETDTSALERYANRLSTVGGLLAESVDLVAESRAIVGRRDAEVARLVDQITIDRVACSAP